MPPEAVVEQGLKAITTFLVDVQTAKANGAQVSSLKLLKVVLVGSAGAGKTRCVVIISEIFLTRRSFSCQPLNLVLTVP